MDEWEALCQSFIGLIRHENASHCALSLVNEVFKEEEHREKLSLTTRLKDVILYNAALFKEHFGAVTK